MERFAERYRGLAFAILTLALVALAFFVVLPFVPALLWATVLSILFYPVYTRILRRLRGGWLDRRGYAENTASLVTTLLALVVILIPFALVGLGLYAQVVDVARQITQGSDGARNPLTVDSVLDQIDRSLQPLAAKVGVRELSVKEFAREHAAEILQNVRQPLGRAARTMGVAALTIVIALLTMFFMVRDGERLRAPAHDLIPLPPARTDLLLARVRETVFAVFAGTVLVAIVQGTIIGATYAVLGVPNALLLGVFSVILCIIPLLGAPILYIPAGLILLANGKTVEALVLWGVGFGIVSQIDNLLKPWLIAGRINLHPMAIFFSILGGVLMFGPVGVMAGPMLLTLVLGLHDVVREWIAQSGEARVAPGLEEPARAV